MIECPLQSIEIWYKMSSLFSRMLIVLQVNLLMYMMHMHFLEHTGRNEKIYYKLYSEQFRNKQIKKLMYT